MFPELSHPSPNSLSDRLGLLFWRLSHALEATGTPDVPVELGRLSGHLLRDIGIDPRSLPAKPQHLVTPPDTLHSRVAMAEFLATTIR